MRVGPTNQLSLFCLLSCREMCRRRSTLALVAVAGVATGGRWETTGAALRDPPRWRRRSRTRRAVNFDFDYDVVRRRLEDTVSEETGESYDLCPFCVDGLDDADRILSTSPGDEIDEITCGELAGFATTLRPSDRLCSTAIRAEPLCCTAQGAMEEASATPSTAQTTVGATDRPAAEATDAATEPATTSESVHAPVKTTEIAQSAQTTTGLTVAETTVATMDEEPASATVATEAPKSTDAVASSEMAELSEWGSGEHAIFAGKSSKSSKEAKGEKEAKGKQAKLFKPAGTLDGPAQTSESGKASKLFAPYVLFKSKKESKSSKGLFAKASGGHSMIQETGAEIAAKPHSSSSKSNKAPVSVMSIASVGKATKKKPHAGGKAIKNDAGMSSWR